MAENLTIARPYAKAIFSQAVADQSLQEWVDILRTLANIVNNSQLIDLLNNPVMDKNQWQSLFDRIVPQCLNTISAELQRQLNNLLKLLIIEKRLPVLPAIFQRYQELVTTQQGLKEAIVISAFSLDSARRASYLCSTYKIMAFSSDD